MFFLIIKKLNRKKDLSVFISTDSDNRENNFLIEPL